MKFRIEVRKPTQMVDLKRLAAALEDGLDQAAQPVYADLQKPAASWKTRVAFVIKRLANGREISTDNKIYGYVNNGTRAHTIRAKKGRYLAFGASSPKTSPNSLSAGAGSRGLADIFRQQVQHPGTDARNFDKVAAKNAETAFPATMRRAIKDGIA